MKLGACLMAFLPASVLKAFDFLLDYALVFESFSYSIYSSIDLFFLLAFSISKIY